MLLSRRLPILILIAFILGGLAYGVVYFNHQPLTRERVIENFEANEEVFIAIQKYIEDEKVLLSASREGANLLLSFNGEIRPISSLDLQPQIEVVLKDLKYDKIFVEKGADSTYTIVFQMNSEGYEQGIVFMNHDYGQYGMQMIKIRKGWYYYSIGYV